MAIDPPATGDEAATPELARSESLGWLTLASFATPAAGYAFYLFFVQFYFLKFATDVLLASPAVMGALFGAGRLWDAVSDPLVGTWSDRTRTRWGRRRPWMLAGVPLLAGFSLMVWSPPPGLVGAWLVAWCAVALLGFYTAYTVYAIPHASLGAELSTDHHERTRVFGAQRMAFFAGMMLAFVGIGYATNAPDLRRGALVVAVATAVVGSGLLLLAPAAMRERAAYQGRGAHQPLRALRDVLRNEHARILLGVLFVEGIGTGALGVLAPYITEYVIGRPELIAVVSAFFLVPSVLSVPLWVVLSRRFGKRNVWMVGVAGNGVFFGATFLVGDGQLALLCALLVGAGVSLGCGGALGPSMLADVIDWDELQSGERREGVYSAAWGFALKTSISIVVVATGFALQLSGFEPNVEQGRAADLTLRGLFAGLPALAALVALGLLRRFRLDAREHARIRRELDRRGSMHA